MTLNVPELGTGRQPPPRANATNQGYDGWVFGRDGCYFFGSAAVASICVALTTHVLPLHGHRTTMHATDTAEMEDTNMSGIRQKELHELLSRDMVDIYVGDENTHWVLHEKLLCHRSPYFRRIFWPSSKDSKGQQKPSGSKNSTYGLPDEDDEPFKLFVGWLYSDRVPVPKEEKELTALFDLYLMAEKWEVKQLVIDVLDTVRRWYHDTDSWPGLRRVQYVYSNTGDDSPLRQLLVSCIARMLVLGSGGMPSHWDKALRRNGQLAVDVILAVQKWKLDPEAVPDARKEDVEPIVEEAEQKAEQKDSEQPTLPNGETHDFDDISTDAGTERPE